jgi:membrane-bound lytic murein transglycosylase D
MERHKIVAAVLVVALGAVLHFAFRRLSGTLPEVFPQISRETVEEITPPIVLNEETPQEELKPEVKQEAVPVKRSGETAALSDGVRDLRPAKRLVSLSPIPKLPPLPSGGVSESFAIPRELSTIVDFWEKIYAVYDTHQVLIHDMNHLEIQYGVLDFSEVDRQTIPDAQKKAIREAEVNKEIARIRGILKELEDPTSAPRTEETKRVAALFRHIDGPDKFKTAQEAVRSQVGLKDRFREGLKRSGRYMPLFEEIFQSYGIPKEITRLVFVESLFKERALSKVGAAGLWQFMADTAKRYMTVDRLVDERYDPIIATHGAARLLLRNHELLGTWPLAINAYNSGPGNLLKAVSKLGTRDIAAIVRNYRTGSYAFASRNFYPSFLAALTVYENQEKYFGPVEKEPLLEFDLLDLPATMTFPEIAYLSDASVEDLKELNPAFAPVVFEGDYSIPAGAQIRLPAGRQDFFAARFVDFYSNVEAPFLHVVGSGESLETIASRYQISLHELQRINGGRGKLERGRVLKIPRVTSVAQDRVSF